MDLGSPSLRGVQDAAIAVFEARVSEAAQLGMPSRHWPPVVHAYPHWRKDFSAAAASADLDITMDEAIDAVNTWIKEVAAAQS